MTIGDYVICIRDPWDDKPLLSSLIVGHRYLIHSVQWNAAQQCNFYRVDASSYTYRDICFISVREARSRKLARILT